MVSQSLNRDGIQRPVTRCGPTHWGWEQGDTWIGLDPLHYLDRSISRVTPHLTEGEANDGLHALLGWTLGLGGLWVMAMVILKGVIGKAGSDGVVYGFKYKLLSSFRCLRCSVGGIPGVCA